LEKVQAMMRFFNVVLCADAGFVKPWKFLQHLEPKPSKFQHVTNNFSCFKPVVV